MTEGARERREQAETFVRDFGRVLFEGSGGDEDREDLPPSRRPLLEELVGRLMGPVPRSAAVAAQPVWASRCCCARPRDACTPRGD